MAKRKPAADPPPIADDVLEKVVTLLVTYRSRADVRRECEENPALKLEPAAAAAAIDLALARIKLAAAIDLDNELGTAHVRLNRLFQRADKVQDFKTALGIQREINRLCALYPTARGGSAATSAGDPADDELAAEIAAARGHLAQIVDAGPDEPLDEIARRAVQRFASEPTRPQATRPQAAAKPAKPKRPTKKR